MDVDNPDREVLTRSVVAAAERGDRLAFVSAVQRYGSLEEARELVRAKAVLRMVDRVTTSSPVILSASVRSVVEENRDGGGAKVERDTLYGHFTVWDSWYEVDSFFEGHFMERTVRGSTKKTMRENRDAMSALFQHGMDPVAGDKPLGAIRDLREDDVGAYYEVELLRDDAGALVNYVSGIVPGIRDGLYGSSFRFRVLREEFDQEPDQSEHNPTGLPERSLKEMQVVEFGPVTFPANPSATASVRSNSSDASGDGEEIPDAPPSPDAAASRTSGNERRDQPRFHSREEWQEWLNSLT